MNTVGVLATFLSVAIIPSDQGVTEPISFDQNIKPLLQRHCLGCHNPDVSKSGLDLSTLASSSSPAASGFAAIVPGDLESSELVYRITTEDQLNRMPPEGTRLSDAEVEVFRRWIAQGANWPSEAGQISKTDHWAYQTRTQPHPPQVSDSLASSVSNPIDRFVVARLESESLSPSPEAEPARLLRRVYLALIGVPPSLEEVDAFLAAPTDQAYATVVDRLLASAQFGEHWARPWLDLARYADSNGFQADQLRESWAYRDWVIDAMNDDLPYDQFVVKQLAGDLLPAPTEADRIATGFHRATTCNVEAGVNPEENRVNQIIDRVNTTATAFLGTTLECAQCHDHKYDPFSQTEYYQLFAFFNNTPIEVTLSKGTQYEFDGPTMELPLTVEEQSKHSRLLTRREALQRRLDRSTAEETALATRLTPELQSINAALENLSPATTLVMVEREEPRETRLLRRGNFLDPGEVVEPGTPSVLHPMATELPRNRLGLGEWLVDPSNPLLARVTVNRWWSELFGHGIVESPEDFGTRAEPPSHPDLLDWLAVELVDRDWSRKELIRLIVMSSTFRQSSMLRPVHRELDPENRLLSRGPRFRMAAEMIRDNALATSGLLSRQIGGPTVMPYQPGGVWRAVGRNAPKWDEDRGPDRYRRGLYVVVRRAAPYPSFVTFDAPDRTTCTVKRPKTNTPLQALVLLNDPAFVEAAYGLADRIIRCCPSASPTDRLTFAFQTVLSRQPQDHEVQELLHLYEREQTRFERSSDQTSEFLSLLPSHMFRPSGSAASEFASWVVVGTVLLNLDETITIN